MEAKHLYVYQSNGTKRTIFSEYMYVCCLFGKEKYHSHVCIFLNCFCCPRSPATCLPRATPRTARSVRHAWVARSEATPSRACVAILEAIASDTTTEIATGSVASRPRRVPSRRRWKRDSLLFPTARIPAVEISDSGGLVS